MRGSLASHVARKSAAATGAPGAVEWARRRCFIYVRRLPRTALEAGGAILEKRGLRGTY